MQTRHTVHSNVYGRTEWTHSADKTHSALVCVWKDRVDTQCRHTDQKHSLQVICEAFSSSGSGRVYVYLATEIVSEMVSDLVSEPMSDLVSELSEK